MLRLVNVEKALEDRGYPQGVSGRLDLEIFDPLLSENGGRWIVEVAKGRAVVQPGGEGHLQLSIDSLAPLYSGFLSAEQLSSAGRVVGAPAQIALADEIFRAEPRLSDFF